MSSTNTNGNTLKAQRKTSLNILISEKSIKTPASKSFIRKKCGKVLPNFQ
jgi:hypothetical protein